MRLMLITQDVELAAHALRAGVDRVFVDLETRGKEERQGHLDTHRASHSVGDLHLLRMALPDAELLARINPLHDGSAREVDEVVAAGADFVMLPMFTCGYEVEAFLDMVDGRARTSLLLETPQALVRLDEILAHADRIDEIHIGLNDLHLGMGLDFMFELVGGGIVEYLSKRIRSAGIRFGFGGIARIGEGIVPAEMIIGEHVRLESEMVILSRSFHQQARTVEELESRIDLAHEIRRIRECADDFRQSDREALERNRRYLQRCINDITADRRAGMEALA